MTRVTFEVGVLSEALKKVAKVLPSPRSDCFDMAGGIVLRVRTGEPVIVQGTNTELWYTEWIDAVRVEGEPVDWRLPSRLADLVGSLPVKPGATVELSGDEATLTVRSGRMSGTLRLVGMAGYPRWQVFSTKGMVPIAAMGDRIAQVAWACHASEAPMTGIWMDGKHLVASKRTSAARVACPWPTPPRAPIVAPMKLLGTVVRHSGDVLVGVSGTQLTVCPDDWTQIRCDTYGEKYPNIARALVTNHERMVSVSRKAFTDTVSRLSNVVKDKASVVKVLVGGGQMAFAVTGSDAGEVFRDGMDAPAADHPPVMLTFSSEVILEGMSKGEGDEMNVHYGTDGNMNRPVYITDGHGYETWYMQRRVA